MLHVKEMIQDLKLIPKMTFEKIGKGIGIGTSSVHDLMTERRDPSLATYFNLVDFHKHHKPAIKRARGKV